MTKGWSTKIVNFLTPRTGVLGCGNTSHIVKKTLFPSKIFFSTPGKIRQTEHVIMMSYREGLPIL